MRKLLLSLCIFFFTHGAFAQGSGVDSIGSWVVVEDNAKGQYTALTNSQEEEAMLFIACLKRGGLQVALLIDPPRFLSKETIDVQLKWGNRPITKGMWRFDTKEGLILLTGAQSKDFLKNLLKHDKLVMSFQIRQNDVNNTFEFEDTKKAFKKITEHCPI